MVALHKQVLGTLESMLRINSIEREIAESKFLIKDNKSKSWLVNKVNASDSEAAFLDSNLSIILTHLAYIGNVSNRVKRNKKIKVLKVCAS